MGRLPGLKRIKPVTLEYLLRFVRKKDCVTIEGDADFVGMRLGRLHRLRENAGRGKAPVNRLANVLIVGRQEQLGVERLQIRPRITPPREHAALQT